MSENRSNLSSTAVSVIGLGMLGSKLAHAFLDHGHESTVWNRTPGKADDLVRRGAVLAASLEEAISASPLVVVCVSDYDAVHALLDPSGDALQGRVLVNLSSGTPETGREMAQWAARRDAGYLDGAAMSGTRLVGQPEALFVFSGSPEAYATHETVLASLGNAKNLGTDAGLASLYDTALYSVIWGALTGFFHGAALVGSENVDATNFASVAIDHFGFITQLMGQYARQIENGRYPADEGTLEVLAGAMDHLIHTSQTKGIGVDVPTLFKVLLDRGIEAGRGDDGIASVIDVIRTPTTGRQEH